MHFYQLLFRLSAKKNPLCTKGRLYITDKYNEYSKRTTIDMLSMPKRLPPAIDMHYKNDFNTVNPFILLYITCDLPVIYQSYVEHSHTVIQ